MHRKSDSEATSIDASTPPRSPPRRPILYYVQSPSQHDVEKMSYGSSPIGSPSHHYHCSPIHHSRESSTSRFSASLKQTHRSLYGGGWKRIDGSGVGGGGGGGKVGMLSMGGDGGLEDGDEEEDGDGKSGNSVRFYAACFLFSFVLLFTMFSLILWGASKSYKPRMLVKGMLFENFNVQAGLDNAGLQTDLLSLNSTVRILYRNRGTFFGVHVTSSPFDLYYYQLKVGTGQMHKFYEKRKSGRNITTVVRGNQVPLYGGISELLGYARSKDSGVHNQKVRVDLNLTFKVRSRAYILGRLVRSKFYTNVRCPVTLDGSKLGKHINLKDSCIYR